MTEFLNQALYVMCGTAWTIAYLFIIIRGFKDKTYGMPFVALAFNIAWEVLFSTIFRDGSFVHEVVNVVWAVLDLVILYTYFRYGIKEWPRRLSPKFFYPYSIFVLLVVFALIYFSTRELHDTTGAYMAYIQNLMMSLLFINMLNNRGNLSGQSTGIAVAKLLGTFTSTILFYLLRVKFIVFTGGLILTFDLIYLLLVLNEGRLVWPIRLKLRS